MQIRSIIVALGMLSALTLRAAENAVLLESFEDNIDSASLMTSFGGRPVLSPPGVALSQYTQTGPGDDNATEGTHSLKVVLSGKDRFSGDFQIKLSSRASAKVRAAMASEDVARYILRYDIVFPPVEDFEYFNSALYFGDSHDFLISAGGKRSMSVALDLATGLPEEGPLTLVFATDFHPKGPFTNVTIYVDNIRLVDTYAPGAKPVTYVLQSFENPANPLGGAADFTLWSATGARTTYTNHAATGPEDAHVTEGRHSLLVNNSNPNLWKADFFLPFNDTKLAEVLKLDAPPEERPTRKQLARYTLRFDVIYPDVTGADWINSTFHTTETFLPTVQSRHTKPGEQRLTYSVTLDQTQWGTALDAHPALVFITEGPQKAASSRLYYDNFRLIDTGNVSAK